MNFMREWKELKLKYISNIQSGEGISKEDYDDNGNFDIIGANGKIGNYNRKNINRMTIGTGRVGTLGKFEIYNNVWFSDNTLGIVPNETVDIKFLCYSLKVKDIEFLSTTTAQPLITATKLGNINIMLPNLKEQKLIANFLDEKVFNLDKILSNLDMQIEILNNYKKSIITETVMNGLNKNIKIKDSECDWIKKVPEHWDTTKR